MTAVIRSLADSLRRFGDDRLEALLVASPRGLPAVRVARDGERAAGRRQRREVGRREAAASPAGFAPSLSPSRQMRWNGTWDFQWEEEVVAVVAVVAEGLGGGEAFWRAPVAESSRHWAEPSGAPRRKKERKEKNQTGQSGPNK